MARITIVIEDNPENTSRPVNVQMDFDPPLPATPREATPAQTVAAMALRAMRGRDDDFEEG